MSDDDGMRQKEKKRLIAEKKFLEERLAALPQSAYITRISTVSLIAHIQKRLDDSV